VRAAVLHRAGRGAVLVRLGRALLPDVLPGDMFVLGSAVGNISFQASQILGFVAGAAVVAVVDPYRTLGLDAVSFGISALIVVTGVRPRPLAIGAPLAVGLAGLIGLTAATMLAVSWIRLHGHLPPARQPGAAES
jgi:hypothetical protein